MKYLTPLFQFVAGWVILMATTFQSSIGLVNGLAQLLLFAVDVHLPIGRTGRMSYVYIGWPLGVAVVGLLLWVGAFSMESVADAQESTILAQSGPPRKPTSRKPTCYFQGPRSAELPLDG